MWAWERECVLWRAHSVLGALQDQCYRVHQMEGETESAKCWPVFYRVSPCCLWGTEYRTRTPDSLGDKIKGKKSPPEKHRDSGKKGKGKEADVH